MNILISSTRQWNPGDEFILIGVRNLIQGVLKKHRINWVLYDRNPDLFIDGFSNPLHKEKIWSNTFSHQKKCKCIDLAVIAGTPEWFGLPMKGFYNAVRAESIPLVLLGVGYIDASISFSEDELFCMRNLLRVATTRDEYASRALRNVGITHKLLPCPALFASEHENVPHMIKKIGFVIQTNKTINQSIPEELIHASIYIIRQLRKKGFIIETICNYIDEFCEFANSLKPVRYSYEALDYIETVNEYDLIITTRLHAAILANSLGKPAILLNNDSRCIGAVKQFPYIFLTMPDNIFRKIENIKLESLKNISFWKSQIKKEYYSLLRPTLKLALGN